MKSIISYLRRKFILWTKLSKEEVFESLYYKCDTVSEKDTICCVISVTFQVQKFFVAAVILFHFLFSINLKCYNVILYNVRKSIYIKKFNCLSRSYVTDITLAKCHGHYILCFWQLGGFNKKRLLHSRWKATWVNWGCVFHHRGYVVSPLVEACKRAMYSAQAFLPSRCKQVVSEGGREGGEGEIGEGRGREVGEGGREKGGRGGREGRRREGWLLYIFQWHHNI